VNLIGSSPWINSDLISQSCVRAFESPSMAIDAIKSWDSNEDESYSILAVNSDDKYASTKSKSVTKSKLV